MVAGIVAKNAETHTTRISTTSFLTATTLIYAIGAGITAAAGPCYPPPLGISS